MGLSDSAVLAELLLAYLFINIKFFKNANITKIETFH